MPFFRSTLAVLFLCVAFVLTACGPGEPATTPTAAPAITTQPVSTVSDGTTPTTLKVVASGGLLTYQWFKDGASLSGATQASYATSTAGSYYVVVTNALGSATSATATLAISVDPVITVQPQAATVTTGKSATLSVVATGTGLSYQWYRSSSLISGATAPSYTASAADTYYVVVSSSRSGAKAVTSSSVTVTVSATAILPAITVQPSPVLATAGTAASFAVTATGTDLTYQWFKDGTQIAGATSASVTISSVAAINAGAYYVVVTNSLGFATSNATTLTVTPVGNGTNTTVVVAAANAFLNTLTAGQQVLAGASSSASTVLFASSLENARAWTSLVGNRHGLRLNSATLTATQLTAADTLISAALSSSGATLMSEIRLSDDALLSLNASSGAGSGLYSIAFIGQPSATQPWLLQLTGHQLTYNITYNAAQTSATPMFIGAEPPNWTFSSGGVYTVNNTTSSNGTPHAALEAQRLAVSALATTLQGSSTIATAAKLPNAVSDLLMGPGLNGDSVYKNQAYPTGTTGRGILVATLSSAQQAAVQTVIQAWVQTQAADVAGTLLGSYLASDALAATYVAYAPGAGGTADFSPYPNASALPGTTGGSYLRIDGPRVWIEFLVKSDGTLTGNVHYRSVWRDKVADYGALF